MRAVLVGLGAVGARCARQLLSSGPTSELVVASRRPDLAEARISALGRPGTVRLVPAEGAALAKAIAGSDVTVLASPTGQHVTAKAAVEVGVPVVSVSDNPADVRSLLQLAEVATSARVSVAVGAGMVPGLSCLLAACAASRLDEVQEVHIASLGTGGPSCAVRHHSALREPVEEWRDGEWGRRVASSGRELVWFPQNLGADCYRVNRPDALLLVPAIPGVRWVTTRAAASRRDRMTSWLPMLRPPHPEGTVGALKIEVRGRRGGRAETVLLGASGRPALVAGAVAACVASRAAAGELVTGSGGLASVVKEPNELLAELVERGVPLMAFEGATPTPAW